FSQTGGYQGVGFAVSTTMAKPIYESLVSTGKVVRGYLGVGIQDLNQELATSFKISDGKGALISDVKEASPADLAGLKQGDVVIEYQGAKVEDGVALQRLVTRTAVGAKVLIKVIRDGREHEVTIRVSEQPSEEHIAKVDVGDGDDVLAGLSVEDLDQDTARALGVKGKAQGVVVTKVQPDSQAEKAGLMQGDVIQAINRQPVKSVRDFAKVSANMKKGEQVLLLILRQGNSLFLSTKV
ncbi:MAG: PDZ domain-containing protein, partial [Candidatus Obscuribacterales bacterium]|nr:PDZ domain-containing protein [Candidatus Obscuribacterales bacterium]